MRGVGELGGILIVLFCILARAGAGAGAGGGGEGRYPYNSLDNLVDNLVICIVNYYIIF